MRSIQKRRQKSEEGVLAEENTIRKNSHKTQATVMRNLFSDVENSVFAATSGIDSYLKR
jgi:hypothetical protein